MNVLHVFPKAITAAVWCNSDIQILNLLIHYFSTIVVSVSVIWVRVGDLSGLHLCSRLIALSVTFNSIIHRLNHCHRTTQMHSGDSKPHKSISWSSSLSPLLLTILTILSLLYCILFIIIM